MLRGPSASLGRIVAWPLIVGGGVLAVAWTAWHVASGQRLEDAVSTSVSGLAAFALGVIAMAVTVDLLAAVFGAFFKNHPGFLLLDKTVPVAAVVGFLVGWAIWK